MEYTAENFHNVPNVSRETLEDFKIYHDLIIKWQKAVNLISPSTLNEIWHRHFADSVGLYNHIDSTIKTIADVGSGGGLPAIVCGIMAKGQNRDLHITLIESDKKKCMFLKECTRILKLNCTVLNERIEKCHGKTFDLMTARALADLPTLLTMASHLTIPNALLLKGEKWETEVRDAQSQGWTMDYTPHSSISNDTAKILHIKSFSKI